MTAHTLQFVSFSEQDRRKVDALPRLGDTDQVEVHVRTKAGQERTIALPRAAVSLIGAIFDSLARGERVAVLSEEKELSPNDAAAMLGISRPLVVHRMDIGDLPFRYVGKHRRARLVDVLALKAKLDEQRSALKALAEDTDELARGYGV
ncbi:MULTISPECIES: helix-turn-helix domain-containing protein [unclassified Phenylobacterium]|uniref:helix-turn-helix domain-containing protein n=1 Tax=unclassified Phenylobacterium TaxID=2640670 RepID=UPI00083A26D0|nr:MULTISPECIES: helix-turn-helix domain-containing protein [unclassified Phenylobacterium]